MTDDVTPPGGGYLLGLTATPFIPEDFSPEQRQIAETTRAFITNEVLPDLERLEQQDFALLREKMRRCAELGLFLVDIPEEDGGLELDKATSMLVAETIARAAPSPSPPAARPASARCLWSTTERTPRNAPTWKSSPAASGSPPTA